MTLARRVRRLQARYVTSPALVRAWTDMLMQLYASLANNTDDSEMNPPPHQVSDAAIAAEAHYLAEHGIPATLSDWFRYVREQDDRDALRERAGQ